MHYQHVVAHATVLEGGSAVAHLPALPHLQLPGALQGVGEGGDAKVQRVFRAGAC